ncbi:MAG TPA: ATP-binding protein [Polyangiaceae bacterium]|nr:ATP-binding protein [Polyangiaceae bacterium]
MRTFALNLGKLRPFALEPPMVTFSDAAKVAVDVLVTPVWLVDVERADLVWANRSALTLFAARTLEELLARARMGEANGFLLAELRRLLPGARLESEFRVLQPGFELLVTCTFTGLDADSGQKLVLVEAHADRNAPTSLRAPEFEQRLQSRDRMASIGTLTAGVVHGINNPLSYVIANLEYVKRLLSPGAGALEANALAELGDVLDDSLDGAERVRSIVSDLGSFSRPLDARVVAVDLERATERALGVAANEIRHRARVVREFSAIPAALATEAKLAQVILSVLINSAHSIETGAVDRNAITVRTRLDPHGRPTLEIEDTGCGIAKENLSRVFDPFFTTKPVGVGTGLGLSVAHRILRELEGEIHLDSVHGRGTRVLITLPAAPLSSTSLPILESLPAFASDRFRARILVIDDEPAILRAFRRVLYSHEVVLATSGPEAMARLAENRNFDVIFCDVMMPEMSGVEVYQRISERHPGQEHKLVFMTGGAFDEPAAQFIDSVENPTLKKPFAGNSVRALVAAVTRLS